MLQIAPRPSGLHGSSGSGASLRRPLLSASLLLLLALLLPGGVLAQTKVKPAEEPRDLWNVQLGTHPNGPSRFVAIDKNKQTLLIMEQQSPLTQREKYFCATGEVPGDKQYEGDLRTPEGVYFVQSRLSRGLDYELYGDLAFTLDYPNPVDKVKGKTGSGIWIHGRGYVPKERETKGCMALATPDMHRIDPLLGRGTPVVIAGDVQWTGDKLPSNTPDELVDKVKAWANAWESKSDAYFQFYDKSRFPKGQGQSFEAFRNHKQGLFRSLPWIQVMVTDVRVLPGPDYWVTYFGQFYRSASLNSEGLKRIYWMPDENGELRIVGELWDAQNLGLEQLFVQQISDSALAFLEAWRTAWETADVNTYASFYAADANQGGRRGRNSIKEQKVELWRDKVPQVVGIDDLNISLQDQGVKISFVQLYQAKGFTDKGLKTLYLEPEGDSWKIVSENWSKL